MTAALVLASEVPAIDVVAAMTATFTASEASAWLAGQFSASGGYEMAERALRNEWLRRQRDPLGTVAAFARAVGCEVERLPVRHSSTTPLMMVRPPLQVPTWKAS